MPTLTILSLNAGDTQQDIGNKINANFDSLVLNGGGPQGQQGDPGPQGAIGSAGPKGDPGAQGTRGNRWYVQSTEPTGGPGDPILIDDYWVNTFLSNEIYEYGASGWVSTGSNLESTELFKSLIGISGPVGSKNAIVLNTAFPETNTFILSDAVSLTPTANPTYSKFLIATNSASDFPILEFAKTNAPGFGTPLDTNRHPQYRWLSSSSTNYSLLFTVPQDEFEIRTGSQLSFRSTNSSLTLSANTSLSLTSGTSMTVTSGTQMTFNSGSSSMTFTSQRFNLSASALSLAVPIVVNASTTGFAMNFSNQNASGNGISVSLSGASSSNFIANFISSGVSRFNVKADGKVFMNQTGTAISTVSGNFNANITVLTKSVFFWFLGTNILRTGNTGIMSIGTSNFRGISFPVGTAANSWTAFLANNESIQFRIISSAETNKIQIIAYHDGVNPLPVDANSVDLGNVGAQFIDFTIMRKSSSTDFNIYYNTSNGFSGKLA